MPPAARLGDPHTCPIHGGGPVLQGSPTVLIASQPAARSGDQCQCFGPPDTIVQGSTTVFVSGMPAARLGDKTAHGGVVSAGAPTVNIGG